MAVATLSGSPSPAKRSYVRTEAHKAVLAARNRLTKRKFPKQHDSKSRLYTIWKAMIFRCHYPSHGAYPRYGGAGIFVCDAWRHDYGAFMQWAVSAGYRAPLTIDRIRNGEGYHPGNCRWATCVEQSRNRSDNVNVSAFGETKTLSEWLTDSRCMVTRSVLYRRIRKGVDAESAITEPSPARKAFEPRFIAAFGETRRLMDWLSDPRCIVSYVTLSARHKLGWDGEISLTVPAKLHIGKEATHCLRGHEFTPDNTKIEKNGTRRCRECTREKERRRARRPKR